MYIIYYSIIKALSSNNRQINKKIDAILKTTSTLVLNSYNEFSTLQKSKKVIYYIII